MLHLMFCFVFHPQHIDIFIITYWSLNVIICFHILCIIRAFDTLAKVLQPGDGSAGDTLEATMQLMSGDQSGPVVELEGPLLSDNHIPFKVDPLTLTLRTKSILHKNCWIFLAKLHPSYVFSPSYNLLLQLMMPLPVPEYLNVNYICESASRLLFLSMHWARSIPAFQTLG